MVPVGLEVSVCACVGWPTEMRPSSLLRCWTIGDGKAWLLLWLEEKFIVALDLFIACYYGCMFLEL